MASPAYIPYADEWPPTRPAAPDELLRLYRQFVNMGCDLDRDNHEGSAPSTEVSTNKSSALWGSLNGKNEKHSAVSARLVKWTALQDTRRATRSAFFSPRQRRQNNVSIFSSPSVASGDPVPPSAAVDDRPPSESGPSSSVRDRPPSGSGMRNAFCPHDLCSQVALDIALRSFECSTPRASVDGKHAHMNIVTCHHFAAFLNAVQTVEEQVQMRDDRRERKRQSKLEDEVAKRTEIVESVFSVLMSTEMCDQRHLNSLDTIITTSTKTLVALEMKLRKSAKDYVKTKLSALNGSAKVSDIIVSPNVRKSWEEVAEEIATMAVDELVPPGALTQAMELIQDSSCISFAALDATVMPQSPWEQRLLFHGILLRVMPVAVMSPPATFCAQNGLVVNMRMHDFCDTNDIQERLALLANSGPRTPSRSKTKSNPQTRGRPPFHATVPGLIKTVTDIVLRNQPSANNRRRDEILRTGVSLSVIRDLVANEHPELIDINVSTIARLLIAPHAHRNSAKAYKGLVQARVQPSTNNERKDNIDAHYSMANAKLAKELIAFIGDEGMEASGDTKASLIVGLHGVVSRYHKNSYVTPEGVLIDKYDHDYLTTGYAISMSGYMEVDHPDNPVYYDDEHGRKHVETGSAGKSTLWLRSTKYGKPDVDTQVKDLMQLLEEKLAAGTLPGVVHVTVDGGHDFNTTRLATVFLYGLIFQKFGLEGLILVRRAGGLSAFNDIERLWAFLSKRLANLLVPATLPGEKMPPSEQELDEDALLDKEAQVFDRAMDAITTELNGREIPGLAFNKHKVTVHKVYTKDGAAYMANRDMRHETLVKINSSTIKECAKLRANLETLKGIIRHVQYSKFKLTFIKCRDPLCDYPQCVAARRPNWVDRAPRFNALMKSFNMISPGPVPNVDMTGKHYLTFLEMVNLAQDGVVFSEPDFHCPSMQKLEGARSCQRDPRCSWYWSFQNPTARTKHDINFHWLERKQCMELPKTKRDYTMVCGTCKYSEPSRI